MEKKVWKKDWRKETIRYIKVSNINESRKKLLFTNFMFDFSPHGFPFIEIAKWNRIRKHKNSIDLSLIKSTDSMILMYQKDINTLINKSKISNPEFLFSANVFVEILSKFQKIYLLCGCSKIINPNFNELLLKSISTRNNDDFSRCLIHNKINEVFKQLGMSKKNESPYKYSKYHLSIQVLFRLRNKVVHKNGDHYNVAHGYFDGSGIIKNWGDFYHFNASHDTNVSFKCHKRIFLEALSILYRYLEDNLYDFSNEVLSIIKQDYENSSKQLRVQYLEPISDKEALRFLTFSLNDEDSGHFLNLTNLLNIEYFKTWYKISSYSANLKIIKIFLVNHIKLKKMLFDCHNSTFQDSDFDEIPAIREVEILYQNLYLDDSWSKEIGFLFSLIRDKIDQNVNSKEDFNYSERFLVMCARRIDWSHLLGRINEEINLLKTLDFKEQQDRNYLEVKW